MHRHARKLAIGLFPIVALLGSTRAAQAELVTNGGFETGSFAGWTQNGDTSFTFVDTDSPHAGAYAAAFGPADPGGISQALITVPGGNYKLQFWIRNEEDVFRDRIPNFLSVSWAGVPVFSRTDALLPAYILVDLDLVATTAITNLAFSFQNVPAFWDLDDVSVAAVPEPDTLALLAIAGGLWSMRSRRRRSAPARGGVAFA